MRMRTAGALSIVLLSSWLAACGSSKESAEAEAKREAEELSKKAGTPQPAIKVRPPVPGEARVPCEQLLDAATFTTALGEVEPLTVKDITKSDAEAAASCSLVKGGAKLTPKEQEKLAKKTNHRLGVLPGDDLCNVTAYCWTVETDEGFRERCAQRAKNAGPPVFRTDESMGNFACVQVVALGAEDVNVYRFFDADTKCILQVRGGPSMTDNEQIKKCAQTARDSIGLDQIAVGNPLPTP